MRGAHQLAIEAKGPGHAIVEQIARGLEGGRGRSGRRGTETTVQISWQQRLRYIQAA